MINLKTLPRVPVALLIGAASGVATSFIVDKPSQACAAIAGGNLAFLALVDLLKFTPKASSDHPTLGKVCQVFWSIVGLGVVLGHLAVCTAGIQETDNTFSFLDSVALTQVSFVITAVLLLCYPSLERDFAELS